MLLTSELARTLLPAGEAAGAGAGPPGGGLVICTAFARARLLEAQDRCRGRGRYFLPCEIHVSPDAGGSLAIGPLVAPASPGCVACAWRREELAAPSPGPGPGPGPGPDAGSAPEPPAAAIAVARVIVGDLAGRLRSGRPSRCRVYVLDVGTLTGRWHRFAAVPDCPHCGGIPADSPRAVPVPLRRRPCPEPGLLRSAPAGGSLLPRLRGAVVDEAYGLITRVTRVGGLPGAPVVAQPAAGGVPYGPALAGVGRTADTQTAEAVAILEALEHTTGTPRARRTVEYGCRAGLGAPCLDPQTVAAHEPASFATPGYGLQPYTATLPMHWVWGCSVTRMTPVLVPEQLAYHLPAAPPGRPARCWQETSSGCALGSSPEEAMVHGLLEVIERDAFLLTWYLRKTPRELAPGTSGRIGRLAESVAAYGYRCRILDVTSEDFGVPVVWVLAEHPAPDPARGVAAFASGICAHPDPWRAIEGALLEARSMIGLRDLAARPREDLAAMLRDPGRVRTPSDHRLMHALPEAADRFRFVLGGPSVQVDEAFPGWRDRWLRRDLTETLLLLTGELADRGLEVFAVDQTPPEHRAMRLRTVKVIVPGTLPITFGHDYRRVHGAARFAAAGGNVIGQPLPHCLA